MKFKKIYIEITNQCNFHCSFCFDNQRPVKYMQEDEFNLIIEKIRPFTDYIYLHVLGEPMMHPQLNEILEIAKEAGLKVNITTNGSFLAKKEAGLNGENVRQINISLHDLEENIPENQWNEKIRELIKTSEELANKGIYMSIRLWNKDANSADKFIHAAISIIQTNYPEINFESQKGHYHTNIRLAERLYLQFAPRFKWPDGETELHGNIRTCYALRDQIAILSNGDVVPCCIDAGANLKLGNILNEELSDILRNPKAIRMRLGFQQGIFTEDYCKTCGFIIQES